MKSVITTALALSLFACGHAYANATLITFDSLSSGTIVTNQFAGVTFTGAEVLTKGVSLNPAFPPVSNPNVVYNYSGDTITASFTSPVDSVSAFVTGNTSTEEEVFHGATLLGSISTPGANFIGAGTGFPPNILLDLSSFGITSVVFTNNGHGSNTFTLDNFRFGTPAGVPSPLIGAGLPGLVAACAGLFLLARHRRRHGIV